MRLLGWQDRAQTPLPEEVAAPFENALKAILLRLEDTPESAGLIKLLGYASDHPHAALRCVLDALYKIYDEIYPLEIREFGSLTMLDNQRLVELKTERGFHERLRGMLELIAVSVDAVVTKALRGFELSTDDFDEALSGIAKAVGWHNSIPDEVRNAFFAQLEEILES